MSRRRNAILFCLGCLLLAGNAHAGKKSYVCHKGETINIANKAVQAHLDHGDVLGRCEDLPTEQAVILFRCAPDGEGGISVTDVSLSLNVPGETPAVAAGDACADSVANLLNNGFGLQNVTSGATGQGLESEYLFTGTFIVTGGTPTE